VAISEHLGSALLAGLTGKKVVDATGRTWFPAVPGVRGVKRLARDGVRGNRDGDLGADHRLASEQVDERHRCADRRTAGRRAASSHTAALAAGETAVEALFHQAGVIRADTLEEMFDVAAVLSAQPLTAGRRVALLTNGGGPGILVADACEAARLLVPELSDGTQAALRAELDLNPVFVRRHGAVVADVRVRLAG
jgi:Succinyl-CoA ligase like flavodoxin domain